MNGPHDLGGMHGFGPVVHEENEPVFHGEWEKQVVGVMWAAWARRLYSLDEMRHGIERMAPADYLASSYYERWLASAEMLLAEKGIVSPDELEARMALLEANADAPVPRHEDPAYVEGMCARITARPSYEREGSAPRFAIGERVRVRNAHPAGHTRSPRYARGRHGEIVAIRGCHIFPDAHAHGQGEQPQPLYNVRFEASELWGESAEAGSSVHIELWESYLEADDATGS